MLPIISQLLPTAANTMFPGRVFLILINHENEAVCKEMQWKMLNAVLSLWTKRIGTDFNDLNFKCHKKIQFDENI